MTVFRVFVSFILTVLKYLKCIDCWESLKTKPYELYYRGWRWPGMGQSFLQFFFHTTSQFWCKDLRFSPLCSVIFFHLHSQHEHEAQLVRSEMETEDSLGEFSDDDLMELPGSPTENPSVIYVNGVGCVSTRDLDLSYSWLISLCSVDTHKNPEFCFLGKYWNSGLKSPSESLEPEVTLSQAYNVHRLQSRLLAAKFTAGTYPYTLRFTISTHFQVVLFLFS